MADQRAQGVVSWKKDGALLNASGDFSFNLGIPKREALESSAGGVVGYTEKPQPAFIEGEIVAKGNFSIAEFLETYDSEVILELRNGKVIKLSHAWIESDGNVDPLTGKLKIKFVSDQQADEIGSF